MRTKQVQVSEGVGELKFSGFQGSAPYRIEGEAEKLRLGPTRVKGSVKLDTETAAAAFRAGDGTLTLEGGARYRVTMLALTSGGDEVFVELRV